MKMYLMLAGGCIFLMCSCDSHSTQEKKKIVDKILGGKEIKLNEMPYNGNSDDQNYYTPQELGRQLGYSEEDLKKLESVVVKLPSNSIEKEE